MYLYVGGRKQATAGAQGLLQHLHATPSDEEEAIVCLSGRKRGE